jgi:hypothetical protein
MGDDALTVRARELAGEISAAEANLAAVLAEIERREIHSQWECRNIERFAGWHLQQSPSRARGLADVGRAMAELPVLAEAVADGTLGFDKARSIARVAAPDTESALVELALHATTAQTQRICGKWRKTEARDSPDPDGQPADGHPTVMVIKGDDGITLTIRFDHVRGELVLASIEAEARAVRAERADAAALDPANECPPVTRTGRSRSSPRPSGGLSACSDSPNAPPPNSLKGCSGRASTPPSSSTSASTPSTAPTSPTPPIVLLDPSVTRCASSSLRGFGSAETSPAGWPATPGCSP